MEPLKNNIENWSTVKLGNVVNLNPKLVNDIKDENVEVSFLRMKLVEGEINKIHLTETRKYAEVKKGFTPMADDDVIFAKITPCMENGKIAIVHSLKNGIAFGSTEFHVLRCNGKLNNKFLFYYLVQKRFRQEAKFNMTGAVGQRRVPKKFLQESLIPLPAYTEQLAIVSKIEELFSEIENGIKSLFTAKQQLKKYRQSVLKWAFEGKLSESGFTRLKDEQDSWNKKILQSSNSENPDSDKGELPEGWKQVSITDLAEKNKHSLKAGPFGSSLKKEFYVEKGYKIYGQEQVINDDPFYGDYYIDEEKYQELKSCKIKPFDILISLVGTVGKVLLLPENCEAGIINPRLIKISLDKDVYSPKFFKYYFESSTVRSFYKAETRGTTMDVLNLRIIKTIPFPLCSIKEQNKIVQEIESRLSVADKMEEGITESLQQAEALKQSILKKAFEGRLIK